MNKRLLAALVAFVMVALCFVSCAPKKEDPLRAGFVKPPDSARPWVYWFWLNGNITREGITADLEAMKRVGIGGVLIMEVDQGAPVGPAAFMGDEWRELFKFAVAEAGRLGLEINMNNDAGWNGSGGPWITPGAVDAEGRLDGDRASPGPRRFDGKLAAAGGRRADYYRDIAVLAFPTPGDYRIADIKGKALYERRDVPPAAETALPAGMTIAPERIVDLTAKMGATGASSGTCPPGKWTILRFGHTPHRRRERARRRERPRPRVRQAEPGGHRGPVRGHDGQARRRRRARRRQGAGRDAHRQLGERRPELDGADARGVPEAARLRPASRSCRC